MRLSTRGPVFPFALPLWKQRLPIVGGVVLIAALIAGPRDIPAAEKPKSDAKTGTAGSAEIVPEKPRAGTPAERSQELMKRTLPDGRTPRRLVTLRGEIVDYYCYIEKGARGPGHRDCGVRCVSGDVCMGLLTTDDRLMMISVNHMRAMSPLEWRDIPDPFNACRALIAEQVDLTGYYMERKGQRIIEVMGVKAVPKQASVAR